MWTEEAITKELSGAANEATPLSIALSVAKETRRQALQEIEALITEKDNLTARNSDLTTVNLALASTNQSLQQQVLDLSAKIEQLDASIHALNRKLYIATRPSVDAHLHIDRTVSRTNRVDQCLFIVTNEHIWSAAGASFVDHTAPFVKALYSQIATHLNAGFGTGDAWRWNGIGPRPPAPHDFNSLERIARVMVKWGQDFMVCPYGPSWHLCRKRGSLLTVAQEFAAGEGRLSGEFREDWKMLVRDCTVKLCTILLTSHPSAKLDVMFFQEFKGMWELLNQGRVLKGQNWADGKNQGTPGFGDIDTVPFYALTIEAFYQAAKILQIPESRFRFGAPYAVIQSKGTRDVDALPAGHPLANKEWGQMSKPPIYAFERCVADIKALGLPFHYGVIDGGTRHRDEVYHHTNPVDSFKLLNKMGEVNEYLLNVMRDMGYPDHELVWAERYLTERPYAGTDMALSPGKRLTDEQDSAPRRVVYTLAGLCTHAWTGAGRLFQWGYRGEDADPWKYNKEKGAQFTVNGDPTPLYDMLLKFKQTFPPGCKLYPVQVEGDDSLGALGTDGKMVVYNKAFQPKSFAVGMQAYILDPSDWAIVDA